MGIVAITSPGSSPGATSLCVGLAMAWSSWDLDPLLIEADPGGGVIGHRFGASGSQAQRDLLTFAVDTRRVFRGEAMAKNLNEIAGFEALLAPVDSVRAHQAITQAAPVISEHLAPSPRPIVVDLGRLDHDSPTLRLAAAADVAYVVLEPKADQVQRALFQLAALRSQGLRPELVFVGEKPFAPAEVAHVADAPIAAVLPFSPRASAALAGGKYKRRSFNRSPLWRSISALARPLASELIRSGTAAPLAPPEVETEAPSPPEVETEAPNDDETESTQESHDDDLILKVWVLGEEGAHADD